METAFDIISLVLFIVVILLAFFRKVNVGVVAVTFGVIMVRIFGYPGLDIENKCWLILGKYNLNELLMSCMNSIEFS